MWASAVEPALGLSHGLPTARVRFIPRPSHDPREVYPTCQQDTLLDLADIGETHGISIGVRVVRVDELCVFLHTIISTITSRSSSSHSGQDSRQPSRRVRIIPRQVVAAVLLVVVV